jgi:hypothetical protein
MAREAEIQNISKEEFERWTEEPITDKAWVKVAEEIEGRTENYLDELLAGLLQDFREGTGVFDETEEASE